MSELIGDQNKADYLVSQITIVGENLEGYVTPWQAPRDDATVN